MIPANSTLVYNNIGTMSPNHNMISASMRTSKQLTKLGETNPKPKERQRSTFLSQNAWVFWLNKRRMLMELLPCLDSSTARTISTSVSVMLNQVQIRSRSHNCLRRVELVSLQFPPEPDFSLLFCSFWFWQFLIFYMLGHYKAHL